MTFAYLYGYPDYVVMVSRSLDVETHTHHAIQITFALDKPLQLTTDTGTISGMGIYISGDLPHQLYSKGGATLNYLIHPESALGLFLRETLVDTHLASTIDYSPTLSQVDWETLTCQTIQEEAIQLWSSLISNQSNPARLDVRIRTAIQYINTMPDIKISAKMIAEKVHLSPSRFMYLFRENTGIPLRRYLLWRRLLIAIDAIITGKSFTTAAHEAGFSDSAHLSRTFKQMFGMTLQTTFTDHAHMTICRDAQAYNP